MASLIICICLQVQQSASGVVPAAGGSPACMPARRGYGQVQQSASGVPAAEGSPACMPAHTPQHESITHTSRPLTSQPVQAAAQQRRGRAGRVRPGVCYRLFSRRTWARMPRDTPPEIARAPLQVGRGLCVLQCWSGQ